MLDLRYEEGGSIGTGLLHSFAHVSEDGQTEMLLAGLLGVCTSNDLGTCRKRTSDPVPCTVISYHLKSPEKHGGQYLP